MANSFPCILYHRQNGNLLCIYDNNQPFFPYNVPSPILPTTPISLRHTDKLIHRGQAKWLLDNVQDIDSLVRRIGCGYLQIC